MFQIFKPGTKFDIVGKQKILLIFSALLVTASIVLVATKGLNYGIDFKGGSDIILKFKKDVTNQDVREAASRIGFEDASVQAFGPAEDNQFLVQTKEVSVMNETKLDAVAAALTALGSTDAKEDMWDINQPDRVDVSFPSEIDPKTLVSSIEGIGFKAVEAEKVTRGTGNNYMIRFRSLGAKVQEGFAKEMPDAFDPSTGLSRMETVGARVGGQLREDGITSLLLSLLAILIYIAIRFDIRYAPGAVLALFHDVAISMGIISLFQMEVSLPTLASILTIVGYSLNDTIVVFDRIRENYTAGRGGSDLRSIINTSLNETLNRTIITSMTTFLAVIVIVWLGSGLIQSFATTLLIGIVVGTYSSLFIASPVLIVMDRWVQNQQAAKKLRQSQSPTIEPSPEV